MRNYKEQLIKLRKERLKTYWILSIGNLIISAMIILLSTSRLMTYSFYIFAVLYWTMIFYLWDKGESL